jgi:hypothetical protein
VAEFVLFDYTGFRCDDIQFSTEMPQHRDGQRLEGVQRTPGHLDKSDLNGGGQAMVIPVAREKKMAARTVAVKVKKSPISTAVSSVGNA